jgi:signal transduction histidine kinase/ligand-binding sensor domain-containing protein
MVSFAMTNLIAAISIGTIALLLAPSPARALDPSLQIVQYAHTAWTVRDGYSLGAVFAMAQTPDGYLWLGSGSGLYRFDGVQFIRWQPPGDQQRPIRSAYSLLSARDGTLWIGGFDGLASWRDGRLTRFPQLDGVFVTSILEDRNGTVWVGGIAPADEGRLCAVRDGRAECTGEAGRFGGFVWSFLEDDAGTLWVGADSGLWRWTPGAPKRFPIPGLRIGDLSKGDDGQVVIGIRDKGLRQLIREKVEPYPIRAGRLAALLDERAVNSNKLLRDRDGGLWIGTGERGLVRVHRGYADAFAKVDGLSGNIICSLFEDREGNVWVATTGGLDRFREFPVRTYTTKQGLTTDAIASVVGATDGSVWLATREGLMRWRDGAARLFRKANGLPGDVAQSLYRDPRGRIWVFTSGGLAYSDGDRFVPVPGVPSQEVFSITGDEAGHLWLSGNRGLTHLLARRAVEHFPWPALGRQQQAKVVLADRGGVWLSFWTDGGVMYFKDGQVRASYSVADGLGKGHVPGLDLDADGALWASTEEGGLSRIEDGSVRTLTTANGLPCDTIHQTVQDADRSLWAYGACGIFRIVRREVDAWIADPTRKIETTLWAAGDGVKLWALAPSSYGPFITRSPDGTLWIASVEGLQMIDPHDLAPNVVPPPVHVERLTSDGHVRWQHVPGAASALPVRLPPRVRDVQIDYTALSLVAPEKLRFKYRLEGQDSNWREVVDDRHVQYSNLRPGPYRFRVIACNNSGVWNEQGDVLEFSVAPAYYQTSWFRASCVAAALVLLWAAHKARVRHLRHEFELALDARVSERTRIARELHDTLLQSFHGLMLRFQTASHLLPDRPADAKQRLEAAIAQAATALEEGRDAVQGLRESTSVDNDLANAISALGQELAAAPGERPVPRVEVTVEGRPRALHPILRDEVYKITAEAMRNAFRHAEPTRVGVEIRYDNDQFRLRVQDDGRGLDAASLSRRDHHGHFGLSGMRERASIVGGTLAVWSSEGAGTAVELQIPGGTAYQRPLTVSWWVRAFGRGPRA